MTEPNYEFPTDPNTDKSMIASHTSLPILRNQLLTPRADKAIYYLELENTQNLDFSPGDWGLVKGENSPDLVEKLLHALQVSAETEVKFGRLGSLPAGQALRNSIEITQLNPAILNKLQRQFSIGQSIWPDRAAMMAYAQGADILDLVEEFAEIRALGSKFLELLSPLAPRYYSLASAPVSGKIGLLYRQVIYQRAGRTRFGVTSNWLANQPAGDSLTIEIKTNPTFKLPSQPDVPIIMIASGTGLAPFLGFMQQRIAQQATDNWLFFGESNPDTTCLQCDQLVAWQAQGNLILFPAFSQATPKAYVQQALDAQREKVWQQWQKGAVVYLCGSQTKMAVGVEAFWQALFVEKMALTASQAAEYWQQMRREKRIQLDVY